MTGTASAARQERGLDQAALAAAVVDKLTYAVGKDPAHAVPRDWCVALTLAVRDRIVDRWIPSTQRTYASGEKRVYYLSMEFLIGRLLGDAIASLEITDACTAALASHGVELADVLASEPDAALGNGGLGRLAACFLDSMARLGIAGYGYGIRYQHGLFRQDFQDGRQVESAEDWLTHGNPWEFERPEVLHPIGFGGKVVTDATGRTRWHPAEEILAKAYDTPIYGHGGAQVNTLRLWSALPARTFDLDRFSKGEFLPAAAAEVLASTLTRVLYPDDSTPEGRKLRLEQEFFFTSASLQDLLRRYLADHDDLARLPDHVAIQMNDTHPAIAVPELMRLLIDEHGLEVEQAAEITRRCLAYTNHTLMPEALERWPVDLLGNVLPRHLQLIKQLHQGLLAKAQNVPPAKIAILADDHVRMGHLAFVGSHRVNGVSALHTTLMKQTVFHDLHQVFPDRIVNQTNGITPRRWLLGCNPELADLLTATIGNDWIADLEAIEALTPHAGDQGFRDAFAAVKLANKRRLAGLIRSELDLTVDPTAAFDVQIKRLHEYKRQFLNLLEIVAHYQAILAAPDADWRPRVKIFAGKAAASYVTAKQIIHLINDVATVINADPVVGDRLKLAFLPNYNVSLAEQIIPAADISEQISTAGTEASGTGNMKLALNGALTVGTLDGANVEIGERVGADNIFIFGMTTDEVVARRAAGYRPADVIATEPRLRAVIDAIASGRFSPEEPDRYRDLIANLEGHDYFMVAADFAAFWAIQRQVDQALGAPDDWCRRAVLNTARMGWFSSDRTIRGYARDIWGALPPAS